MLEIVVVVDGKELSFKRPHLSAYVDSHLTINNVHIEEIKDGEQPQGWPKDATRKKTFHKIAVFKNWDYWFYSPRNPE